MVSLITGDKVTVLPDGTYAVTSGRGVSFIRYGVKGHRYIIPSDAIGLIKAGRLDRGLFDIDQLLAAKSAQAGSLRLLVTGASSAPGLIVERKLPAVRGFATKIDHDKLAAMWPGLRKGLTKGKVWLDGLRKPSLDASVPLIGAPAAWAAGHDGTGVTVAVLDTGIDSAHPDLAGKVVAQRNFSAGEEDDLDRVGHGTHVAGTIAGTGAASAGRYKGVAPGAHLLDGKVCAQWGCPESWILAGMQWAAESGADVVNMSLGGPNGPEVDPLEEAVNDLSAQYGTLFVIAAGNDGADDTVSSPATAAAALAVGATSKTDELAEFSSRGPSADGYAVKPEITAPGVAIVAARGKDGGFGDPGQSYTSLSGTSMATPHVSGAAAILSQVHPQWSAARRKATLMAAAKPHPSISVFAQGAGRIDVAKAIGQQITSTPTAVNFGLQQWPHDDDDPATETLQYHNDGASAVTLNLALTTSAPAGMFQLSADSITIQAGGQASVTFTTDPRVGQAHTGGMGGHVTASSDNGTTVQTPFGIVMEPEVYDVRLNSVQRDGAPAEQAHMILINTGTFAMHEVDGSTANLRLPPGSYFAASWISETSAFTQLTYPELLIDGPQTINWDARSGKGYDITVPDRDARFSVGAYNFVAENGIGAGSHPTDFLGLANFYSGHVGPRGGQGGFSAFNATFAKPDEEGRFEQSPYLYHVGAHVVGSAMEGLTKHVAPNELATVEASYAAHIPQTDAVRLDQFGVPGVGGSGAIAVPFALPLRRTEYYAGTGQWQSSFSEWRFGGDPDDWFFAFAIQAAAEYVAGRSYLEEWNRAALGPSVGLSWDNLPLLFRNGDIIEAEAALIGDSHGRLGVNLDAGHVALYRDDTLIAKFDGPFGRFDVPPTQARYRLETSAYRKSRLSTEVHAIWTFNSATTQNVTALPIMAVSFRAPVNDYNTGRKAQKAGIPITVRKSGDVGTLTALTLEVSHNDGKDWQRVPVIKIFGTWLATVTHPNSAGLMSLRLTATDDRGNTVEETIIRAYEIG